MLTVVHGQRVACVFPCINGSNVVVDSTVVTTDDAKVPTFSVWHVEGNVEHSTYLLDTLSTFPAAIRSARKFQGWG